MAIHAVNLGGIHDQGAIKAVEAVACKRAGPFLHGAMTSDFCAFHEEDMGLVILSQDMRNSRGRKNVGACCAFDRDAKIWINPRERLASRMA
jgi:hypothetical protein